MDSDKIKAIVALVNCLDNDPEENKNTQHIIKIMDVMLMNCTKSPNFAVAIIQHLRDKGIDLLDQDNQSSNDFKTKFSPVVDRLGDSELLQIRKISSRLFSQTSSSS